MNPQAADGLVHYSCAELLHCNPAGDNPVKEEDWED